MPAEALAAVKYILMIKYDHIAYAKYKCIFI